METLVYIPGRDLEGRDHGNLWILLQAAVVPVADYPLQLEAGLDKMVIIVIADHGKL